MPEAESGVSSAETEGKPVESATSFPGARLRRTSQPTAAPAARTRSPAAKSVHPVHERTREVRDGAGATLTLMVRSYTRCRPRSAVAAPVATYAVRLSLNVCAPVALAATTQENWTVSSEASGAFWASLGSTSNPAPLRVAVRYGPTFSVSIVTGPGPGTCDRAVEVTAVPRCSRTTTSNSSS